MTATENMALVVLLRGVNVGGHRRLRPSVLARQLAHLGAVNIGAAGTLVIRRPVSRAALKAEIARRLPFGAEVTVCGASEIRRLLAGDHLAGEARGAGIVQFVSVLARRPRRMPELPLCLPARGRWFLRIAALDHRFVVGQYRRHMKVIGFLGSIDQLFGTPATTRSWSTLMAVARVLEEGKARDGHSAA